MHVIVDVDPSMDKAVKLWLIKTFFPNRNLLRNIDLHRVNNRVFRETAVDNSQDRVQFFGFGSVWLTRLSVRFALFNSAMAGRYSSDIISIASPARSRSKISMYSAS